MKLKANLHFHSKEDPLDKINYSIFEGINAAHKHKFNVLASTCHTKNVCTDEHINYAKTKNILLIPGIEANVYEKKSKKRSHVVILNCNKEANNIKTFDDLRLYKKNNPDIFIIAPHPYFYGNYSLGNLLEKHIDIFDAIEISWFYTKFFNRNKKAIEIAKKYNKPLISTSDTHFLDFLNDNFIKVETDELSAEKLFSSIRNGNHKNVTSHRTLFEIFFIFAPKAIWSQILRFFD
jgi:predicted metal-dependent phosphoesterase TrpH